MWYKIIVFLILNFGALGIGGMLMGEGPASDWYVNLNKAPWTPPGWVFGAAWASLMIFFAVYMAYAWQNTNTRSWLIFLFILQWIINVSWNPVFFKFHLVLPALIIILALTLIIAYMLFAYFSELKIRSLLILPYLIWLLIACSLNAYILFKN
ncbi:MAG: tryptophan-rich sensory protein [Bacteroidales bacterium]|nr:tryptophan-rich sensory protein [Bacteroidales bacterium]